MGVDSLHTELNIGFLKVYSYFFPVETFKIMLKVDNVKILLNITYIRC